MAKTRRAYTGAAVSTTTASSIAASGTTSFTVTAATGWPYGSDPFFVVVEPGTASEEKILVTRAGSGDTTINIASDSQRGQDGTVAVSHSSGSTVFPVFTALDADEANELASKWTTKGDLVSHSASTFERLAVGTNDYVLTAASGETSGLKWAQVATGGIANDAVTTAKIDDEAVTKAKISTTDYAGMGLVHIASADFSAVASFNIDNCFSSQYRNYRLVLTTTTTVGAQTIFARLRTGSTDTGSNYYWGGYYLQYGSSTITGEGSTAAVDTWRISQSGGDSALTMDIFNPNVADKTMYISNSLDDANYTRTHNGYNTTATQYTGLHVYFIGTSMTGRYSMYGYNNG